MDWILEHISEELRARALTHPAFAATRGESFERLEYLGDSVLDLVISAALFDRFPEFAEGELSRVRAAVVSRDSCEVVAREHRLGEAMIDHAAGRGAAHEATARRLADQRNALAALVESIVGAGFLELGYEALAPHVLAVFEDRIEYALANRVDAKSQLQELASRDGAVVAYDEVGEDGPPHDRRFTMMATVDGASAQGSGRSKQEAQQRAAAALLELMEEQG